VSGVAGTSGAVKGAETKFFKKQNQKLNFSAFNFILLAGNR